MVVISATYVAFNRYELPQMDWVNIDHRRATPFASRDLGAAMRSLKELTPDLNVRAEAVHRLDTFGAVVTNASSGTTEAGFGAEWRMIQVILVDGDRVVRCEIFDEADINAALARFDELTQSAPQFENVAEKVGSPIASGCISRPMTGTALRRSWPRAFSLMTVVR